MNGPEPYDACAKSASCAFGLTMIRRVREIGVVRVRVDDDARAAGERLKQARVRLVQRDHDGRLVGVLHARHMLKVVRAHLPTLDRALQRGDDCARVERTAVGERGAFAQLERVAQAVRSR